MTCKDFIIPNQKAYKPIMLELNFNDENFEKICDSEGGNNFMKFLSSKIIKEKLSNLNDYFNDISLPIKFIVLFGTPPNKNCLDGIHKDSYPMEGYDASNYCINFSVDNSENSFIVFFDELKNEICRKNYDVCPILFRTDVFHSVLNFSDNIRITASLRFDKSLEDKLKKFMD
jgi:hypothetical protein